MSRADNLDLFKGTLGLLLLKAVQRSPAHGHQIMNWIREVTDGTFLPEEGAIYPALHRLEEKGYVRARWGLTENRRRARYYEITRRGEKQLGNEEDRWNRYVESMRRALEALGDQQVARREHS